MLDIQLIRKDPDLVSQALAKRGLEIDFSSFLAEDQLRRQKITEVEQMKAKRNKLSAQVPQLKKAGQDATEVLAELKALSDSIKTLDEEVNQLSKDQEIFLLGLTNMQAEEVVAGGKENNQVEKVY